MRTQRLVPPLASLGRVLGGLLVLWLLGTASAQAQDPSLRHPAASSYRVVAVRVEFQPDTTRFTTGDGTFSGPLFDETLSPNVDPLPHDAAYFQAHLDFLEHYVETVSDAQTRIDTYLVPEVIRVSQPMAAYSPTGPDATSAEEQAKLYALVREVWETADAQSSFDFAGFHPERTAFVLFHAGVGRDVELIGTTLDKTPQDLPSLTLDTERFAEFVGTASFNGFPVTNTLIIPRTETRQGFNFITDEPFLLELSINGLLAASFFNYLGVPDLFNTETGETAIGQFGLMDPNGIFAYRGLFPPQPMAWTRYYLGWEEPVDVAPEDLETVTLAAAALNEGNSIARVPISSAEYFLVENRHRDPEGDGLVLRVWQNGQVVEQRVENGDEEFDGTFSIEGFIGGVVVGVDTYDWALPGGLLRESNGDPVLDDDGNPIPLNGGLLIWHIDERRIADGSFNVDPRRRAIALEEADSAVDIGFDAPDAFVNGSPFDFWYEGNSITVITATDREVRLYENRFGPDTFPNTNTNAGGPSFITMEDFTPTGTEMMFVVSQAGDAGVTPLFDLDLATQPWNHIGEYKKGSSILASNLESDEVAVFAHSDSLQIDQADDERLASNLTVFKHLEGEVQSPGPQHYDELAKPTIYDERSPETALTINVRHVAGALLGFFLQRPIDLTPQDPYVLDGLLSVEVEKRLPPISPLIGLGPINAAIAFSDDRSSYVIRANIEGFDGTAEFFNSDEKLLAMTGDGQGGVLLTKPDRVEELEGVARWTYRSLQDEAVGHPAFGTDRSGSVGVIPVLSDDELLWLHADGSTSVVHVAQYASDPSAEMNGYPVLADLDGDARLDVVTTYGSTLLAFSQGGALVPGFPVTLAAPALAQPLVAELSDSGNWSIVIASTNGNVYAYDMGRGGRQVSGFPLAVGRRIEATPLLHERTLYAVSLEGTLKAWRLDDLGAIWWGQLYANAQNTSHVELDLGPEPTPNETAGLLVAAETYNWPNPVQDGQTYLRCMTTKRAIVRITIIDAAGSLIDEMELTVPAGTPAEHLWQTDAPSGLYFARVEATADDGTTDTHLVKLAIIR